MTDAEKREALARIASELDRLRQEAERLDAGMLAFLIAQAMDEAKALSPQ
jgi:hypothetical protein